MTQHQTMNTIIHAAIRRDLERFDIALAGFPPGSRPRAGELTAAWRNLSEQLQDHHDDEESIFWPMLHDDGSTDVLLSELEVEHRAMLGALKTADGAMGAFASEPSAEIAASAHAAVGDLQSVVDAHLAHEEHDLEPVLVGKLGTPEMKGALAAVRKKHKGDAGTFFSWLQDGASKDDLAALRNEVPPPVLFMLTRLSGRNYRRRIASVWN